MKSSLLVSRPCRDQESITIGTIFQTTRFNLKLWLRGLWLGTSKKNEVSTLGIHLVIDIVIFITSWTKLHKPRRERVWPRRDNIIGTIEIQEMYVARENQRNQISRVIWNSVVAISVELVAKTIVRVRLCRRKDALWSRLASAICKLLTANIVLRINEWRGYLPIQNTYRQVIFYAF